MEEKEDISFEKLVENDFLFKKTMETGALLKSFYEKVDREAQKRNDELLKELARNLLYDFMTTEKFAERIWRKKLESLSNQGKKANDLKIEASDSLRR